MFPTNAPRWLSMWCLSVAIYGWLKWYSWHRRRIATAPAWRHLAYLFAWPGMDADAFLDVTRLAARPSLGEWVFATVKLLFGVLLMTVAAPRVSFASDWAVGWVGMFALVFVLHFGVFHLLSCWWRGWSVNAIPIMQWPILSESVGEFWGVRWNRAFRDLTHQFVFRPLTPRIGAARAMFAGFVLSGVVHDLVITVPAGAGWGGPTAFFVIQGLAVALEHSRSGRKLGLGRGVRGRLFAALVLLTPLPWLFPRAFAVEVIVPFMHALGVN